MHVLRATKRPMTAKAIFNAALKADLVPPHLHGKTQHKTLQARLSEEILHNRSGSLFYRTEPGHFFLSEFMANPNIPDRFKEPFPARRRTRDLQTQPQLVIDEDFLSECGSLNNWRWNTFIDSAFRNKAARFVDPVEKDNSSVSVWTFSIVKKKSCVLSYRLGRYRDDRDSFANKKTIGFPGSVCINDQTLFSADDLGASENALNVILSDMDLSTHAFSGDQLKMPEITSMLHVIGDDDTSAFLIVSLWDCPEWFEPTNRKLSINNPQWTNVSVPPNDLHDFEPWSVSALEALSGLSFWRNQKVG